MSDPADPAHTDPAEPGAAEPSSDSTEPADERTNESADESRSDRAADEAKQVYVDPRKRPTYMFFGIVSGISLLADVGTKAWAELVLKADSPMNPKLLLGVDPSIVVLKDHLTLTLAYNKGGAWGLLQGSPENVRRPFFLLVSVLAIAFIVSLYSRLAPGQRALKWGLPLVLGGALGNLADRIVRSSVIDFIDYRAAWIESMNRFIAKYSTSWTVTDHWPTFNVADISICIGVALMGIDMIGSRRKPERAAPPAAGEASPPSSAAPTPGGPSSTTDASAPADPPQA